MVDMITNAFFRWLQIQVTVMSTSPFSQALSPDAKMLNRVAQGRLPFTDAVRWFESLPEEDQRSWLRTIAFMCHQAHPHLEEIDPAITLAELKTTFTPCVMIRAAVQPEHALDRIAALPADERLKSFQLVFALYCIADTRRRETQCRNGCSHEWHNFDTNMD
jgi:hypothetical protein